MHGKQLTQTRTRTAIHQNIKLMLKAKPLSYRFDPTFGCLANKYYAHTPAQKKSERLWREEIRESLQQNLRDLLQRYESRVSAKDVIVDLLEPKAKDKRQVVKLKVEMTGHLTLGSRERFHYPDSEIADDAQEALPLVIPVGAK